MRLRSQCYMNLRSFFFSSRRRHTRWPRDWSSDVCSSDLGRGCPMSALLASAPLLLRRRGAIADLLPIIAFAAAPGSTATGTRGLFASIGRLPAGGPPGPPDGEAAGIGLPVVGAAVSAPLLV